MTNDWIKPGARVYLKSISNWIRSGYTTIVKVDEEFIYLQKDHRIKIDIHTLNGDYLDFHDICHIYHSKEDIELNIDIYKKRKIIIGNLHLLSENEIDEIYNIIIKNK